MSEIVITYSDDTQETLKSNKSAVKVRFDENPAIVSIDEFEFMGNETKASPVEDKLKSTSLYQSRVHQYVSRLCFRGFDSVDLREISQNTGIYRTIEIANISNLHLCSNNYLVEGHWSGARVAIPAETRRVFFHSSFSSEFFYQDLPADSKVYWVNPEIHPERNFGLPKTWPPITGIIGVDSTVGEIKSRAVADWICFDNFNFPKSDDWRINLIAKKDLYLARVVKEHFGTFWRNSEIRDDFTTTKHSAILNSTRLDMYEIAKHLQDFLGYRMPTFKQEEFLRSTENALVASGDFRNAMDLNSVRKWYELRNCSANLNFFARSLDWFNGFAFGFQNSPGRILLFMFLAILATLCAIVFQSIDFPLDCFHCWINENGFDRCGTWWNNFQEIFVSTIKLMIFPFRNESECSTRLQQLIAFFSSLLFGIGAFSFKHWYNRYSNYKW